jgi:hypothetical protein
MRIKIETSDVFEVMLSINDVTHSFIYLFLSSMSFINTSPNGLMSFINGPLHMQKQ